MSGQAGRRVRPWATGELARLFGVTQQTIINWIDAGKFGTSPRDVWRTTGGKRRVRAGAVESYRKRRSSK